tara:strand:- start:730 stop:1044 length:315 start_codon:yes stop_codon:yes gene_type:complete
VIQFHLEDPVNPEVLVILEDPVNLGFLEYLHPEVLVVLGFLEYLDPVILVNPEDLEDPVILVNLEDLEYLLQMVQSIQHHQFHLLKLKWKKQYLLGYWSQITDH